MWSIDHRNDDGNKVYSTSVLNDNSLWLNANKTQPDGGGDNIATYHNVSASHRNEGMANVVFVDGHVETRKGLAGRDDSEEYGKPYRSHDDVSNIW